MQGTPCIIHVMIFTMMKSMQPPWLSSVPGCNLNCRCIIRSITPNHLKERDYDVMRHGLRQKYQMISHFCSWILHSLSWFLFCACLDDDQHFSNLEDDIAYFKDKWEVIVFTDMCPRSLQLDAQQFLMPQISWMQEDIQMHSCFSIDDKDLDQIWCVSLFLLPWEG